MCLYRYNRNKRHCFLKSDETELLLLSERVVEFILREMCCFIRQDTLICLCCEGRVLVGMEGEVKTRGSKTTVHHNVKWLIVLLVLLIRLPP